MRILVAVDGSDAADRATQHAIGLGTALAAPPKLHLIHVDPHPLPTTALLLEASEADSYHEENSRRATRRARLRLKSAALDVTTHYVVGDPASAILALARKTKFDLIVMGSHGRSALQNVLLGSVACKVLSHCTVPVTIVR